MPGVNRSWVFAVAGLAAAFVLVVSVVVSSRAYKLVHIPVPFQQRSLNCMPSDLPTYRGMTLVSAGYNYGNPAPGDTTYCTMTWSTHDRYSDVESFYRKALNSGEWATNQLNGGQGSMDIGFYLIDRPATHGWATVSRAIGTEVQVTLFS
jgi:hypothetical protein